LVGNHQLPRVIVQCVTQYCDDLLFTIIITFLPTPWKRPYSSSHLSLEKL